MQSVTSLYCLFAYALFIYIYIIIYLLYINLVVMTLLMPLADPPLFIILTMAYLSNYNKVGEYEPCSSPGI